MKKASSLALACSLACFAGASIAAVGCTSLLGDFTSVSATPGIDGGSRPTPDASSTSDTGTGGEPDGAMPSCSPTQYMCPGAGPGAPPICVQSDDTACAGCNDV